MRAGRIVATCALVLAGATAIAQPLSPALTERFSAGVVAFKDGQLDAAERAFRDVLRAGRAPAFVHHNLGLVLREQSRHADALREFTTASTIDPAFGPARLLAGTTLLTLGRPTDAVAELERAAQLMPRERVAHLQLAEAYERTDNVPRLVDVCRRIAELSPDEPEHAYRLGRAYLKLSEWAHTTIRSVNPGSARLRQALGRAYLQQERPDLALAALSEAARADPTLPGVHLALARIHFDRGRFDEAAREIDQELAIAPESREARALNERIVAARRTP